MISVSHRCTTDQGNLSEICHSNLLSRFCHDSGAIAARQSANPRRRLSHAAVFDGFIGAMIGGFEMAVGAVLRIGTMVEPAVGERPAQPFMEQQKEQRDLDAL